MFARRQFLQSAVSMGLAGSMAGGMAAPAWAQTVQPDLPPDTDLIRTLLETLHPGLYRYQSPRQFDRAHRRFEREWSADEQLEARYLSLSRLLSQIRCGHSYANFFNQSEAVQSALFDRPSRLPFAFRWIGDAMVVTANHSGAGGRTPVWLPVGSVIKAVNGVPARTLLARLLPYVRVDGHNGGKARALLSVTGADSFEFFDVFHGLVFGAPAGGQFNIHYRAPDTAGDVWADMPALTLAERRSQMPAGAASDDGPAWQWTVRDDGVAVLTMDGWALFNSRWDWRAWLNERLDSLSGARGLIVDIRQNEGGLDCGDLILARLTDRPLPQPAGRRLVRYRTVPPALRPALDTWDRSFFDWGDDAEPVDSRYFLLRADGNAEGLAPDPRRLTLPVAILTSAQNSSATFQFALQAKRHGLATLVGETTGGNQRGINGGAFFFARLPQSGLEFDIPLIGYFPDQLQPDAGVEPDVMVTASPADIAVGYDRAMETAATTLLHR